MRILKPSASNFKGSRKMISSTLIEVSVFYKYKRRSVNKQIVVCLSETGQLYRYLLYSTAWRTTDVHKMAGPHTSSLVRELCISNRRSQDISFRSCWHTLPFLFQCWSHTSPRTVEEQHYYNMKYYNHFVNKLWSICPKGVLSTSCRNGVRYTGS